MGFCARESEKLAVAAYGEKRCLKSAITAVSRSGVGLRGMIFQDRALLLEGLARVDVLFSFSLNSLCCLSEAIYCKGEIVS